MIRIEVSNLKKDSEKFLEILLRKKEQTGEYALSCDIDEFREIPNIKYNINSILEDLKIYGCITNASTLFIGGNMSIYLTMEGIDYFKDKEKEYRGGFMSNNINNFYGNVSNMQLQQGTVNSTQTQKITSTETIDFDKVAEFIDNIKKYDIFLESEYGERASEVRERLVKLEELVQKRENSGKIKLLLSELKNLSVGVVGSLIASGIVEGIKAFI